MSLSFPSRTALLAGFVALLMSGAGARDWTLPDGAALQADFYFRDDRETWFKNRDGTLHVLDNTEVAAEDRQFIDRLESYVTGPESEPWPRQILPSGGFRVTGGPQTYRSENFQVFAAESREDLVNESAQILENAYDMIRRLPLPLDPAPPQPLKHFTVRMLDRPQFETAFGGSVKNLYPEKLKGAYMARQRELWLPLDADPARDFSSTLVHEMAHQSMHDWLPLLPLWFIEGFAEYLAAIPYESRIFRFDRAEEGLREVLRTRYGSPPLILSHPARQLSSEAWQNSSTDYLSSLFLVFFLAEYDHDSKGSALRAYLGEIEKARTETDTWFNEIQSMADDYNRRVREFQSEMTQYQSKIEAVKSELRSGQRVFVRESGPNRVVIGDTPAIPARPQAPEKPAGLPEVIANQSETMNLITSAKQRAILKLLQGRDFEELAEEMKNAFHSRGFEIEFR